MNRWESRLTDHRAAFASSDSSPAASPFAPSTLRYTRNVASAVLCQLNAGALRSPRSIIDSRSALSLRTCASACAHASVSLGFDQKSTTGNLRYRRSVGRYDRPAARHRLHHRQAKALVQRRHDDDLRQVVERRAASSSGTCPSRITSCSSPSLSTVALTSAWPGRPGAIPPASTTRLFRQKLALFSEDRFQKDGNVLPGGQAPHMQNERFAEAVAARYGGHIGSRATAETVHCPGLNTLRVPSMPAASGIVALPASDILRHRDHGAERGVPPAGRAACYTIATTRCGAAGSEASPYRGW